MAIGELAGDAYKSEQPLHSTAQKSKALRTLIGITGRLRTTSTLNKQHSR